MTTILIIGLLIPLLGTMLGSAFVFFIKDEMSVRLQKTLLGFASGVMVAASVWSLLIPAMEMGASSQSSSVGEAFASVVPAAVGFLLGMGFLLMIDELTPHQHIGTDKPEGPRSRLSRTALQSQHYRFRHRLRPDDGTRRGDGIVRLYLNADGNMRVSDRNVLLHICQRRKDWGNQAGHKFA